MKNQMDVVGTMMKYMRMGQFELYHTPNGENQLYLVNDGTNPIGIIKQSMLGDDIQFSHMNVVVTFENVDNSLDTMHNMLNECVMVQYGAM